MALNSCKWRQKRLKESSINLITCRQLYTVRHSFKQLLSMCNRRRWLLTEKNGFKRLKSTLNGSKRSLNGFKCFKTAFSSSERLLMTRSGFIEPKIALNYSIPMDIHFRSIFVDFWIFKKILSKIQLFLKNRNLGRNFVLAENHWKLTLGQF